MICQSADSFNRMSALEAAVEYTRAGLRIVPVAHRGKECILRGWPGLQLKEADLAQHFPPTAPANIGIINGTPSGGWVDVDLDVPQATGAANHFLPITGCVSGRAGNPRSHRWYKVDEPPETNTFKDADGTMLIELRSTGTQTVVPPGVHPTGELVIWHEKNGEPTRVEADALRSAVQRVAAATIIGRNWPAKGSRHDAALALAGGLLRAGWATADVEAFVLAVADAANDEEARQRVRDVLSTAAKIEGAEHTTGWPSLARLLGPHGNEVVSRARQWLAISIPAEPATATAPPATWPSPPGGEAFYGLAGEFVRIVDPTTESDRVAVLVQTLIGFGNLIGRAAYFEVECDRHYANEFVVLVGRSAKARKGTSSSRVRAFLRPADESWADTREVSGLSSGEGFIWAVRDSVERQEMVKSGDEERFETIVVDAGVADKRLLVMEPEFAGVLKQTERQGNTLTVHLRQAWDSGRLQTLTKHSPVRATGAHVSIIGHITAEELCRYLTATETANGFANRFVYVAVQRSKLLPEGGQLDKIALAQLGDRLWAAAEFARGLGEVRRNAEAGELWADLYPVLSADRPGVAGALLARAEAHVMRLALIYALLDRSPVIRVEHLAAAAALWDYAERSVLFVFGDSTGNSVADNILGLLQANPSGLKRSDITKYLANNVAAARLNQALRLLMQHGLARREERDSGGRPAEWWFPVSSGPS
jgi:hypothetical protein